MNAKLKKFFKENDIEIVTMITMLGAMLYGGFLGYQVGASKGYAEGFSDGDEDTLTMINSLLDQGTLSWADDIPEEGIVKLVEGKYSIVKNDE